MNNQSVNVQYNDQIKMKVSEVFQKNSKQTQTNIIESILIVFIILFWNTLQSFLQESNETHYTYELTIKMMLFISIVIRLIKRKTTQNSQQLLSLGLSLQVCNTLLIVIFKDISLLQSEQLLDQFILFILLHQYIYNRYHMQLNYIHQIVSISVLVLYQVIFGYHLTFSFKMIIVQLVFIEQKYLRQQRLQNEIQKKIQEFNIEFDQLKQQQQDQINKYQEDIETKSQQQLQSRANDLVNKLKLIKFKQQCQIKNEIMKFENQQDKLQSMVSITEFLGKDEIEEAETPNLMIQQHNQNFKRRASRTLSQNTDLKRVQPLQQSHSDHDVIHNDTQITLDEIDDLLNLLTGKKDNIWLPKFLRSHRQLDCNNNNNNNDQHPQEKEEQFSQEAKKFIISHFTQKETSFQYIDDMREDQDDMTLNTFIDFNQDYLQPEQTLTNLDQSQMMIFLEGSINLFKIFGVIKTLKIKNLEILGEFSVKIDSLYQKNFYHNSMHAIDVANSTAFFLQNGLQTILDDFQATCLLISALAHDIGHPGLNNGFMTSNRCRLALLFNDQSVLENYHSFLLFQVLSQQKYNILENLQPNEIKGFRKYSLNLILDTDLTRHFQLMNKFQNYVNLVESQPMDPQLIMSIAIKCADVGHGAKEIKLHKIWSRRIIEEFFLQGDLELFLKVPVSPMCDRKQNVSQSQEGFLKGIVLPMFEAFSNYLNNDILQKICVDQIKRNLKYWQEQQQEKDFMEETQFDTNSGLEVLQKFLHEPLHIDI